MSDTEKAVAEYLREAGITYRATHAGLTSRDNGGGKPWECDAWRVTFTKPGLTPFSTDYYTGTGLRKKTKKGWPDRQPVPVTPPAAGVLYSLTLDAAALDQPFHYWCADYGYEEDSRKALATYDQCVAIGRQLAAFFTREQLATLRDMLQDY